MEAMPTSSGRSDRAQGDTRDQPICTSVSQVQMAVTHSLGYPYSRARVSGLGLGLVAEEHLFWESATIARDVNLVEVDLARQLWLDGTAYVEEKRRCSGVAHCAKREVRRRHACRWVREENGRRALHSSEELVHIHHVQHGEEGTILLDGRAREA
eukprot:scaffold549_cov72-Phaeocystis_antarctica.AAC.5